MSKNITIQEGGTAKQFTAQKLQTNLVGGGTQLWVPEDEAGDYANYEELSVTENGTYVPSENADGFSKIEVDVNPELEDITITRNGVYESHEKYGYGRIEVDVDAGGDIETGTLTVTANGTYYSSDDDLDGYDEVIVDIDGALTLKELTVNENGTYRASDDDADGYYIVHVNVSGGIGSATNDGLPTIENGITPGGIGSSVIGTDPEDGNEYAVGVNEDGEIVKTKVPSAIHIGKAPDKTTYVSGETMDYSGIIVILQSKDDALFANADYPNGRIPISELVFPVEVAPEGSEGGKTSDLDTSLVKPLQITPAHTILFHGVNGWTPNTFINYPCLTYWYENVQTSGVNNYRVIAFSDHAGDCYLEYEGGRRGGGGTMNTYEHNGKTVYYHTFNNPGVGGTIDSLPQNTVDLAHMDNINIAMSAWTALYGESTGGTVEIPVQWKSPYDGRVFDDKFEITITPANNSGT